MAVQMDLNIKNLKNDNWVNPFKATPEELMAASMEPSGLVTPETTINGTNYDALYASYCRRRKNFQEATRLGGILINQDVITKEQLQEALERQSKTLQTLGQVLIEMKLCTQEDVTRALEEQVTIRHNIEEIEKAESKLKRFLNSLVSYIQDKP